MGCVTSSKPFIQTAVRFDVQIVGVCVGNVEQLLRVAVYRAAVVDFELDAEMAKALAVKYKIRRVAVLVNYIMVVVPAVRTVDVVIVIPIGTVAKRVRIILDGVLLVDPLSTVIADYGQAICTVLAEPVTFHLVYVINRMLCTAVCTNSRFIHCPFLHFVW